MPVVDASVVVDWVAPDSDAASPARMLLRRWASEGVGLLGPQLLLEEVSNALVTGVRRRRWSGAQADAAYAILGQLPLAVRDVPADLDRAFELSRRFDEHPVYDMVYVALAERLGEQLMTADAALVRKVVPLPFVRLVT